MIYNELKDMIVENGLSIPKMANIVGISKKTLYQKMHEKSQFKQHEILTIKNTLRLTDKQVNNIFFTA